jgi:hypothetical protein
VAMWDRYAGNGQAGSCGIAIRSTVGRLRSCLPPKIAVGAVQYVHFRRPDISDESPFVSFSEPYQRFFHKERAYMDEIELRAVFIERPCRAGRELVGEENPLAGRMFAPSLQS